MSERNLAPKFCVNIGKSASETFVRLKIIHGKYTMKKTSVLSGKCSSKKNEKMFVITQKMGSQKYKEKVKMWIECGDWCIQIED